MLLHDGKHKADSGLWLSGSEAELLHAALSRVLADNDHERHEPASSL
ncbi:hypothetical protein ACSMX9_06280 [Streptomyces sp. LE64]